jgi:hypothetical protein
MAWNDYLPSTETMGNVAPWAQLGLGGISLIDQIIQANRQKKMQDEMRAKMNAPLDWQQFYTGDAGDAEYTRAVMKKLATEGTPVGEAGNVTLGTARAMRKEQLIAEAMDRAQRARSGELGAYGSMAGMTPMRSGSVDPFGGFANKAANEAMIRARLEATRLARQQQPGQQVNLRDVGMQREYPIQEDPFEFDSGLYTQGYGERG